MRPVIKWRNLSPEGLAAAGNQSLSQRVLDLLADIMFAAEEIRDMVDIEHGFPPFEGFDEALTHIRSEAQGVIERIYRDLAKL